MLCNVFYCGNRKKTVQIIPAKKEDDYSPSKSTLAKTLRKFPIKAADT